MFNKMIFKKVLFPVSSGALLTFTVTAQSEEKKDEEKKELVRRKDLSLYPVKKEESAAPVKEEEAKPDSALMSAVKKAREAVWSVTKQAQDIVDAVNHAVETGKAHASSSIQILREEENYKQRYGAIAAGGLVGYIVAIRRGWFRKIIYTGTGAAAVAAIVYPEEAKEISAEGFQFAKQYIVIAYHFINGDKNQGKKKSSKPKKEKEEKPDKKKLDNENKEKQVEPKPASFDIPDPQHPVAEQERVFSMYSRRL